MTYNIYIEEELKEILRKLGLNPSDRADLTAFILKELVSTEDLGITEHVIFERFNSYEVNGKTLPEILATEMSGRAEIIFGQLDKYLIPVGTPHETRLIDFGCGDAQVTKLIRDRIGFSVTGCDISDYRVPETEDIPFIRLDEGSSKSNFPESTFDYAIATNVFHHAENNEKILRELRRILKPGGKLIVIETVPKRDKPQDWEITFFFDYLYNRVFHDPETTDVPVPGTYELTENWPVRLRSSGFSLDRDEYEVLGFDQALIPDWHILYALTLVED